MALYMMVSPSRPSGGVCLDMDRILMNRTGMTRWRRPLLTQVDAVKAGYCHVAGRHSSGPSG